MRHLIGRLTILGVAAALALVAAIPGAANAVNNWINGGSCSVRGHRGTFHYDLDSPAGYGAYLDWARLDMSGIGGMDESRVYWRNGASRPWSVTRFGPADRRVGSTTQYDVTIGRDITHIWFELQDASGNWCSTRTMNVDG